MDIALAVEEIYPAADYRRCDDYETLVRTWKDARKVPTLEALEAVWPAVQAKYAAIADKEQEAADSRAILDNPTEWSKLTLEQKVEHLYVLARSG